MAYSVLCCSTESTANLDTVNLKTMYLDKGDLIQCSFENSKNKDGLPNPG